MVIALMGAAFVTFAQGSAGPAADYVARFDCSIQSTLNGQPFGESYRETITVSRWSNNQENVAIRRHLDGYDVDDFGHLYLQQTPEGRLHISISTGVAMITFTEVGGTDGRFRYSGNRLVMDVGGVQMDGLCQSDIRTQPPMPQLATGRTQ